MTDFSAWFLSVTGKSPFPYQMRLATSPELPSLLNVPTGAGKTAAVVLGWLWRRHYADAAIRRNTPRRLVYCLPMRTLVEQTYSEVKVWLQNAGLDDKVELHLLMGGAVSQRWDAYPEKDCILVGTQDQLLSRALNRGYSMSRYRWPIHFALLNNDCLWVMDEVQLMGAALKTTAQLQGFREIFGTYGITKSLWMSATLDRQLLQTVNYQPDFVSLISESLSAADLADEELRRRMNSSKRLVKANTVLSGKEKEEVYAKQLAAEVAKAHVPGSLTIIICNRVQRSLAVYKKLTEQELLKDEPRLLIHSRFRGAERKKLSEQLRDRHLSGILVATQAIEAGVDISATRIFTELAPWSSFVQRVGRCNRYGGDIDATVYWIDMESISQEAASPYEIEALQSAQQLLNKLTDSGVNVGPTSLEEFLAQEENPPKLKVEGLIPRQHDLLQLFDTSTDLAGHDIDISSFIRETDESDVAIAWRNWSGEKPPSDSSDANYRGALQQDELCRVSIAQAKKFLEKRSAWTFDRLPGEWKQVKAQEIYPGMSLLLHCWVGGYSQELGFTGGSEKPEPVPLTESIQPDKDESDLLSLGAKDFVSLKVHSQDVFAQAHKLCEALPDFNLPTQIIIQAALWHDAGKAHPEFQKMLTHNRPAQQGVEVWAKSDHNYKKPEDRYQPEPDRRGFRHELVSALLALQQGKEFLLVYLVACHHGKVRMTIQPRPEEKAPKGVEMYALGVHHGDEVAAVDLGAGEKVEPQTLSLECMQLGDNEQGESWVARAIALLEEYGSFKLAFLETLIRIADWRGSAKNLLEDTDA